MAHHRQGNLPQCSASHLKPPVCSLLVLISLWFIAGCTKVGPNYLRPETRVATAWLEASDRRVKAEEATVKEWWRLFDDPVLNELIDTAYRQNLSLRAAAVRIFESRAQLGIAVGQFFPQSQQALGDLNFNRLSETSLSAPQPGTFKNFDFSYWQTSVGAGATWELDFWGRYRRGIESADAGLLGSIAAYDNVLVALLGDVADNYILIRTLEEQLKIARANVEVQRESLGIAQARFQGGATSERDVQQALTQLNATEATIPRLEAALRQTKNALCLLLGMPPTGMEEQLSGREGIPVVPKEVEVGFPAELLRRRPDIRYAEYQAAAQCAQIGVAKADLYPIFSLTGDFGFLASSQGHFSLGEITSWKSRTGSIGPTFQWNILNYGQITNNVRLQDALYQGLLVAYQNSVLQAQKEVEDGLIAFLQAQDRLVFLAKAAEAAKRSADLALIQYREGATDYTTVLTAQQALLAQQDSLAQGQGDVPRGLVKVYRSLGGGWEIREGKDFLPGETREVMKHRTDWGDLLTPAAVQPAGDEREDRFRGPDW